MNAPDESPRPRLLAGSCFCRGVQYAIEDSFEYALNCSNCRRATGAAFKPFAGIQRDKLNLTRGAESILDVLRLRSSHARRKRCQRRRRGHR